MLTGTVDVVHEVALPLGQLLVKPLFCGAARGLEVGDELVDGGTAPTVRGPTFFFHQLAQRLLSRGICRGWLCLPEVHDPVQVVPGVFQSTLRGDRERRYDGQSDQDCGGNQ